MPGRPHRLRHAAAAAALLSLLVLLAFGIERAGSAGRWGPAPAGGPASVCHRLRGQTRPVALTIPGEGVRTALVRIPLRAPARRVPLVIALHGAHASGAFMEGYSGLSRLADQAGFAVAYPDAAPPRHRWTLRPGQGPDDVSFVNRLLDRLLAGRCFDRERVSVVGVSNGGGLAALLGCDASGRLAAIAAVAGGYGDLPECRPDHRLSVLEIHGTADPVVPYHAHPGDVLEWLNSWVARDGCRRTPHRRAVAARVMRFDWAPCRAGTRVEHLAIAGGVHAWPGAVPADPGPRLALSAAAEAWRFFAGKRCFLSAAGDG